MVATKEEREKYTVCVPCNREELVRAGVEPMRGYDERSFERRVGAKAKYVLVRPDCFVHSVARTGSRTRRKAWVANSRLQDGVNVEARLTLMLS